jgi:hypothetical protein
VQEEPVTDTPQTLRLERLYATSKGQPDTPYTMAARSPGASPDQLAEFRRLANLLPPMPAQRNDAMPGALGLFRAESVDYVMVKAHQGQTGLHFLYLMLPAPYVRQLGGNIRAFESWAKEPITTFNTVREDLPPFQFEGMDAADFDTQTDDLLTLISYCKNNLKTVGGLLAGLVQAMGVAVINAPLSLSERITFTQGLLTLLPRPVRANITWATSVIDPSQTNAQIKFLAWDVRPARHLIFDWTSGKLLNEAQEDHYANYIMAQLRLDTSLVIEQTMMLERTAIWRMMRKDELSNALGWASRRATLDAAINNGLPADLKMIAGVLREDPTLTDEMRARYARHMLAVSVTLNEPERADILAPVCAKFRNVYDAVSEYLKEAAADTVRAPAVYALLSRWIMNSDDIESARWRPLLSAALLTRAKIALGTGNAAQVTTFLDSLLDEPPKLALESTAAQIIAASRRAAYTSEDTARALFLAAVTYLPASSLSRLLTEPPFLARLPEAIRAVIPHFMPNARRPAPAGVIARAASVYGTERRTLILARLAELSMMAQRLDLLDQEVLIGLIDMAMSPNGSRFDLLSEHIVNDLSQAASLRTLDQKAIRSLVAINLVRNRPEAAIGQLEFYQNELYKGASADVMGNLVQTLFRETALTPAQLNSFFDLMQNSQLRTSTRAHAYFGALAARDWSPEFDSVARRLTAIISNDASLIPILGFDNVMRLVQATVTRHDVVDTLRLSSALVENALLLGVQGPEMVEKIFGMINWGPEMVASSLEVLRAYIRRAPISYARALVDTSAKRYGDATRKALEATYAIRVLLNGANLNAFVEQVTVAASLLQDMAATYHESQEPPSILNLRRTVESITGGLSDAERERLAMNFYRIADLILQFARQKGKGSKRDGQVQLFNNQTPPATGLDALRWIGGHFAQGRQTPLRLERTDTPHLTGNRSVNTLLRETEVMLTLFDNMINAFPEGAPELDNEAFRSEIDSLWGLLNLYTQRQVIAPLSENAQLLAEVIVYIGEHGNERSLASSGHGQSLQKGRAQPKNVIECLRWINGYFMKQHT